MKIGIDRIAFATTNYYIDLKDLAQKRNIDENKYLKGIMQEKMSVQTEKDDIINLAYKSSKKVVDNENIDNIDYVIFATETGIDNSKASSIIIKDLLNLSDYTRCIEVKQACYSLTVALNMAYLYVYKNPNKKVLIVASDISKYGLNSSGEPTQGVGSIAMIISKNPKIAEYLDDSIFFTNDVWDFYRPIDKMYPIVDGKLSINTYLKMLETVYIKYKEKNNIEDIEAFCFHIPYSKMAYKAIDVIKNIENTELPNRIYDNIDKSIKLNTIVGNIYTGSLFLNLLSLLQDKKIKQGSKITMYSYGSGATAEMYTLKLSENYEKYIDNYFDILDKRIKLDIDEYENKFLNKVDYEKKYNKNVISNE